MWEAGLQPLVLAPEHRAVLSVLLSCVQGGNPFVTPDSTVHNPKTQGSDVELGQKPVTAPAEQKAVP